jgi:hypothetical protein
MRFCYDNPMTNNHCYLFALEINPLEVGGVYDELPLHCTLMHRFWSKLNPDDLSDKVQSLLATYKQVRLNAIERTVLGPKRVTVSEIEFTDEFKNLHMALYKLLNDLDVEYTAPEWVGNGYKAHVTERENVKLTVGSQHVSKAIYLIEVEVPEHENKRLIRTKFDLEA